MDTPPGVAFDSRLVKESFAYVEAHASAVMEHFHAHLFTQNPQLRGMFALTLTEHADSFFAGLARIVWNLDSPVQLDSYLARLGRDHRKFGVKARHGAAFFSTLLETVRQFSGQRWSPAIQAAWEGALGHVWEVMTAAAEDDARRQPAWWVGEVVRHDLRAPDLAVLTIRPDQPLRYTPGQYLAVQVPRWPRIWRNYSIANAPRRDGLLDLHVRAVPGGMVSTSLVYHTQPGDTLLLGPARGTMTASPDAASGLLCIAGGTGLAPIKAIAEGVITAPARSRFRDIVLIVGARRAEGHYDLRDLRAMESAYPALSVIPVISAEPGVSGDATNIADVAVRQEIPDDCHVFISGPPGMVWETVEHVVGRVSADRIHYDPPDAPR